MLTSSAASGFEDVSLPSCGTSNARRSGIPIEIGLTAFVGPGEDHPAVLSFASLVLEAEYIAATIPVVCSSGEEQAGEASACGATAREIT